MFRTTSKTNGRLRDRSATRGRPIHPRKSRTGLLAVVLAVAALSTALSASTASAGVSNQPYPYHLTYEAHVQDKGWLGYVGSGETAGTTGQNLRAEALSFLLLEPTESGAWRTGFISCQPHVQGLGWMQALYGPTPCGTTGQSRRLEAVKLTLGYPEFLAGYGIEYRCHVSTIGWTQWVRDGATCGTTGRGLQMEAIQARLYRWY